MESSIRVSETLVEKLERVPLLIEYFATCGIRQAKLLTHITKTQQARRPLLASLQPDELLKAGLEIEVTSSYPPMNKSSFPLPADIQQVMMLL